LTCTARGWPTDEQHAFFFPQARPDACPRMPLRTQRHVRIPSLCPEMLTVHQDLPAATASNLSEANANATAILTATTVPEEAEESHSNQHQTSPQRLVRIVQKYGLDPIIFYATAISYYSHIRSLIHSGPILHGIRKLLADTEKLGGSRCTPLLFVVPPVAHSGWLWVTGVSTATWVTRTMIFNDGRM
jgi:hypothetical protein